ncbi:MAG: hypothetical protein H5T84_03245 [Thermoleophilia bacterium]|nr:hypothetical protein [Thermoleophilia bacterium]
MRYARLLMSILLSLEVTVPLYDLRRQVTMVVCGWASALGAVVVTEQ